jgi:hypothetical protein
VEVFCEHGNEPSGSIKCWEEKTYTCKKKKRKTVLTIIIIIIIIYIIFSIEVKVPPKFSLPST